MKRTMLSLTLCAGALIAIGVGCHKDPARPAEGPMERAGRKVDDAAVTVKDETKAAAKKTKEEAKDAKDTVKKKTD